MGGFDCPAVVFAVDEGQGVSSADCSFFDDSVQDSGHAVSVAPTVLFPGPRRWHTSKRTLPSPTSNWPPTPSRRSTPRSEGQAATCSFGASME